MRSSYLVPVRFRFVFVVVLFCYVVRYLSPHGFFALGETNVSEFLCVTFSFFGDDAQESLVVPKTADNKCVP